MVVRMALLDGRTHQLHEADDPSSQQITFAIVVVFSPKPDVFDNLIIGKHILSCPYYTL